LNICFRSGDNHKTSCLRLHFKFNFVKTYLFITLLCYNNTWSLKCYSGQKQHVIYVTNYFQTRLTCYTRQTHVTSITHVTHVTHMSHTSHTCYTRHIHVTHITHMLHTSHKSTRSRFQHLTLISVSFQLLPVLVRWHLMTDE